MNDLLLNTKSHDHDAYTVEALMGELCNAVVASENKQKNNDPNVKNVHFEKTTSSNVESHYFEIIQEAQAFNNLQNEMVIEENIASSESCSLTPDFVINDANSSNLTSSNDKSSTVITLIPETDLSGVSSNATKLEQSSNASTSTCLSQKTQESNNSSFLLSMQSISHKLIGESNNLASGNYFRGCKWAPDGLCFLANSNDNFVKIFNTPHECVANRIENIESPVILDDCLRVKEPGLVYDYCWWPLMNSHDPSTCCFATTSLNQPVHLWDAFTGALRASYISLNSVHELSSANSICFSNDGRQLLCGYKKDVCLFYTDRPGAHYERWSTMKKKQRKSQNNIISCVEFCPDDSMFACGCYDGTIGIYSPINGHLLDLTAAHTTGITCIKFSKDGYRLYSGVRNAESIKCWDIRNIQTPIFTIKRTVTTNQRIYFDLMYDVNNDIELSIISGSTNGDVCLWRTSDVVDKMHENAYWETKELENAYSFKAHNDCANGCSFHPYLPLLVTSSGQRWFPEVCDSDDENSDVLLCKSNDGENTTKLWFLFGQEAS